MDNKNLKNITPEIVRAAVDTIAKGGREDALGRAEAWNELLTNSRELAGVVEGSVLIERLTRCDPQAALQNHLQCIDFGFHVALELVRAGKLDKATAEKFSMGFSPRSAA